MADDDDGGLPEEATGKLEQTNAVPVKAVGPYRIDSSTRQIFENIDDMYDYGTDIVYGRRAKTSTSITLFIVVDNSDDANLLYPNQPNYWIGERTPPAPEYAGDDESFRGDVHFWPLYEYSQLRAEEGGNPLRQPAGSIIAGNYKGVSVYLPDPTIDYSRPKSQTDSTTGKTTGTTVKTTTTVTPGTAGGTTQTETVPGEVSSRFDSKGATPAATTSSVSSRFDSKGATPTPAVTGGRGNGAAEVAQRQANAAVASTTASSVVTGADPCIPNNPPASATASGSSSAPPSGVPYDDAIIRQARAAAAAPASVIPDPLDAFGGAGAAVGGASGGRGNGAAEVAQRRAAATATAPTTVTQPPSTPTSSTTATPRPPSVYIYEALTPGFDRYDFNTGKKVYTPNGGASRNAAGQTAVPDPTPTVPPIDGGIPVGTTTAATGSLLKQRQAALSGGAG